MNAPHHVPMAPTTSLTANVIAAWGRVETPQLLAPGVTRVDDLVFKRASASLEWVTWEHRVLVCASDDGVRFQRIVPALDGHLVVAGWVARTYLPGGHRAAAWQEILSATEAVSRSLARVPASVAEPMPDARHDAWAVADRMAWSQHAIPAELRDPVVEELVGLQRAVQAPSQLVHGDMTGNVLFADGLPPGVIDFSPYRRPSGYAIGIVIADAVVWHGAALSVLHRVALLPDGFQCLVRAMLFRHLTALGLGHGQPTGGAARRYADLRAAVAAMVDRSEAPPH